MIKNIVLIGFLGTGKTTIGRYIANKYHYTIREIEAIHQLHDVPRKGKQLFIIKYDLVTDNTLKSLQHNSVFIWLRSNFVKVAHNVLDNNHKTYMLQNYYESNAFVKCRKYTNAHKTMINLEPFYRELAQYQLDVSDLTILQVQEAMNKICMRISN